MKEVVIMSYSHRTFSVLLLSLASCWLFALVEAQKSPPQCSNIGQVRPGNAEHSNGSCGIVNLTNIEVCESDGWRELCDTDLSDEDAQVICRELNYSDIGAAADRYQQQIGGFPTTTFPVCKGNEQRLSDCPMSRRNGAACPVNKLFVTCYNMSDSDPTMCGISTESYSTTSDESTMRGASSTAPEPLHPITPVVDSSSATSTSELRSVTSTQELDTSQQTRRNTLPPHITISVGASVGLFLFVVVALMMCMIVTIVCYKRTRREKNNDQVSPDSPVKVRKSHETDGKDLESGMYSELNNTVAQHQVPIYECVNKSQNLSEVSATESNENHHTYAALDPEAIYTQIAPHVGPGKSSTLPAGLSGREPSLHYKKLDHSLSLPRSTAPPTSSSGTGHIVAHAVNQTALAFASGRINETDLASPTQSESSLRYPSPRGSPKQCLPSSAKYPSPRGSPKQYHSSQSSTASKEGAPLIRDHSNNHIVMQNYAVLVPEATSSSAVIDQERDRYDNDSQASTDAVCNQQMSENCQPHSHINCELGGVTLGETVEDSNRHLYAILDPSPDPKHSPPSYHNTRQRSQSAVNNRSPPQQQKMYSQGRRVTGHGLDYSGHRVVTPNKYSQSQFHSSSTEFSNDPQMDTLV